MSVTNQKKKPEAIVKAINEKAKSVKPVAQYDIFDILRELHQDDLKDLEKQPAVVLVGGPQVNKQNKEACSIAFPVPLNIAGEIFMENKLAYLVIVDANSFNQKITPA